MKRRARLVRRPAGVVLGLFWEPRGRPGLAALPPRHAKARALRPALPLPAGGARPSQLPRVQYGCRLNHCIVYLSPHQQILIIE